MSHQDLLPIIYIAYGVAGAAFLVAVSTVFIRLLLGCVLRGASSGKPLGQELVWTLVPALVFVGLTVLGDIRHRWENVAAGDGGAATHARLAR